MAHDNCVFSLLKNLQTVLCDDCNNYIPLYHLQGFPFPILSILLLLSLFLLGTAVYRHSNSPLSLIQYLFPWWLVRHRVLLVCLVLNTDWVMHISLEKSLVNFISDVLTKLLFSFAIEFIIPYCIFIMQFLQL